MHDPALSASLKFRFETFTEKNAFGVADGE
jgi:hypothetical protein